MRKIISLFKRNYDGDYLVYDEVVPGAEWVVMGEGVATRKWDGTCCMVRDGKLYKRYDAKAFTVGDGGVKKAYDRQPPPGFEPAQDPDPVTGHWPGWIPVSDTKPEDKWFREAVNPTIPKDGTYELCGPKLQGNPERLAFHVLIEHGGEELPDCPRDFEGLRAYLRNKDIEGVVWHHADGRMVKIKARDFGFSRP